MADDLTLTAGRDYGDTLWTPTPESAARTEIVRYIRWLAANGGPDVRVDTVAGDTVIVGKAEFTRT